MKKLVLIAILVLAFGAFTTSVTADPGPYSTDLAGDSYDDGSGTAAPTPDDTGTSPQVWEVIDRLLTHASLTGISSNEETDQYQWLAQNESWIQLGGGTASNFAAIGITAGNSNTLGVYDVADPGTIIDVIGPNTGDLFLGAGTVGSPYPGGVNPFVLGQNFGFSLLSDDIAGGGSMTNQWYSDPSLNSDGLDHMLTYYLPQLAGSSFYVDFGLGAELFTLSADTFVIAWEDLPLGSDQFDDDYNDTVFVITRVAPVPEPASMVLLGSGLLGLVGVRRKRS